MKLISIMFLSVIACGATAQTAGKITFEEKMDLHRTLPPDRQEMKDMMPQFNTALFELTFSGDQSVYQAKKVEEIQEVTANQGGTRMTMRFGRDNRIVYKNMAEDKMIDSRDFMQKQFLITGPLKARKWKIGSKQKEILGYNCMEASFRVDSATALVAWFAPTLTTANGPSDFQGLPGMILQIDINDGERMITATEILTDSVDTSVIVAPDKGKEVTAEEFEKIREEKMKEMGIQHGGPGGGRQMIMIRQ
jgi:GLPGLI family protein